MSRIGKLPIDIPAGVTVSKDSEGIITVKGPLGTMSQKLTTSVNVEIEEGTVNVYRKSDSIVDRSQHGLARTLIFNMVKGVSEMFILQLELIGVGYRAATTGQVLELNLGYSHPILFELCPEVLVEATSEKRQNSIITLKSCDKQLLGQVAAKIRSYRKPEPYKGKGVKFVGEVLRRKAGKTAGAK